MWLGRHAFDVDERYDPIKTIGRGAYGVVCSANNRVAPLGARNTVAIKKLTNCFDSPVEARRALREVHLLRRLKHENVIKLEDIMMPVGDNGRMDDVYLVYELMDTDLHQIIRSKQALLDEHCQYFIYQILRGLKYVHSAKVLHRDLKPSNILLNANCDLCICDFGLARSMVERGRMMTSYVVTRWYRAPELLLNSEEYAASIDMWSVGCILAEIIDRKPLFPGKDFIHQMRLIIETLGSPEEADMDFISSPYARKYIASLPRKPKVDFAALYPDANPLAIDLLERTLVFDPRRRISVDDALAHPYLASLHDASNGADVRARGGRPALQVSRRARRPHSGRVLARGHLQSNAGHEVGASGGQSVVDSPSPSPRVRKRFCKRRLKTTTLHRRALRASRSGRSSGASARR